MREFRIGDTVKLKDEREHIEYFTSHFMGIDRREVFTIIGYGGSKTVGLDCKPNEYISPNRLEPCTKIMGTLTLLEPVVKTIEGTVYKHVVSGEFVIETEHGFLDLSEDATQQIKQYIESRNQFDKELFTL